MNDFMYDPLAVRQQQVDPMAVRQQPMPVPGTPVYNNPMAMNAANGIYGSSQMRQQSVMMVGDLDKDGKLNDYEANRQAKINEAMAQQK